MQQGWVMDNKMIYVEWTDSLLENSRWQLLQQVENQILKCATVGFMISDTDEFITIAQSYTLDRPFEDISVSGTMTIPKGSIIRLEELSMVKTLPVNDDEL